MGWPEVIFEIRRLPRSASSHIRFHRSQARAFTAPAIWAGSRMTEELTSLVVLMIRSSYTDIALSSVTLMPH
jgi:hypothetical protein